MVPTSLPELPKSSRTLGKSPKPVIQNPNNYRENKETNIIFLEYLFLDPIRGELYLYCLPYGALYSAGPQYAQTLIVVVLILVKCVGFLVITS